MRTQGLDLGLSPGDLDCVMTAVTHPYLHHAARGQAQSQRGPVGRSKGVRAASTDGCAHDLARLLGDVDPDLVGLGFDDRLPADKDALGQCGAGHGPDITSGPVPATSGLRALQCGVSPDYSSHMIVEEFAVYIFCSTVFDPAEHVRRPLKINAPPRRVRVVFS
ncbi:hypothetical protein D3C80_1610100 [compost metagenome]